jgi:hypothetical protein
MWGYPLLVPQLRVSNSANEPLPGRGIPTSYSRRCEIGASRLDKKIIIVVIVRAECISTVAEIL